LHDTPVSADVLRVVINQMDTTQTHLGSKSVAAAREAAKPDNLSKEELNSVLKYGAQKMCVHLAARFLSIL
jgi:hypothetical protein